MSGDHGKERAGLAMLRSLRSYGVEYVFGNFGTDHPPFLEAAAEIQREDPDAIPEFIICPHETVALSAAHGYAVSTGNPQAVIVHVDVGTQNLGAMVHNAHRGNAPVYIIAGLAPHSQGGQPESRDSWVHYLQDVYDQPGIVREFCRWTAEYRAPADPDELVARGLQLASTPPEGPVYLTATRESLAAQVSTDIGSRDVAGVDRRQADPAMVERIAGAINGADAPLVLTSKIGSRDPDRSVDALVRFAEAAGAGVLESGPASLCFPRNHELHVGHTTDRPFERADLLLLVDVDIPWVPSQDDVPEDLTIFHIDRDPEKAAYPRWDFPIDYRVTANATATLEAVTDRLADSAPADTSVWTDLHASQRTSWEETVAADRSDHHLSAATLTDTIDAHVDDETIVVNESTTNNLAVLRGITRDLPGSYYFSHGSGLGWAPGAGVGVKLAHPDKRVVTLVGDGSYVFGNPTASAWVQGAFDAPTLTIVLNNSGWNAVHAANLRVHPEGRGATEGTPGSAFEPRMELSHAAHVVDAHSESVTEYAALEEAVAAGFEAVDAGTPAVLDVHLDPI